MLEEDQMVDETLYLYRRKRNLTPGQRALRKRAQLVAEKKEIRMQIGQRLQCDPTNVTLDTAFQLACNAEGAARWALQTTLDAVENGSPLPKIVFYWGRARVVSGE
jgi:hypothetical protein